MDRIFLDANVLFSAAYREDSSLRRLWDLKDVVLLTSAYALEEARRNLDAAEQRDRLEGLASHLEIVLSGPTTIDLPEAVDLPQKDRPILQAAIEAGASHLLTGDRKAFGRYYGQRLSGALVLKPSAYLSASERSQSGPLRGLSPSSPG